MQLNPFEEATEMNTTPATQTSRTWRTLRWTRRAGPLAAAAVAIALLAGCGGGGSSGGGQAGSSSSKHDDVNREVRYAQCMRAHGVLSFPDPTSGAIQLTKTVVESPRYQSASQACRSLAPAGAYQGGQVPPQEQAQALAFARCIRSHGVPDFPDPSFSGGAVALGNPHGNNSPAFNAAQRTCRSLVPGGGPAQTSGGGS